MSVRVCATVTFAEAVPSGLRERVCETLGRCAKAAQGAQVGARFQAFEASHAGLHLEGSLGGGDLTWDLLLPGGASIEELRAAFGGSGGARLVAWACAEDRELCEAVAAVEAWIVEPIAQRVSRRGLAGIKRTNFVRLLPEASPSAIVQWTREVPLLAERVPAIRNWSLARVRPLFHAEPRVVWTHAWEQEFETVEGLLEDYMASPYHWGFLDGWYDCEVPKCIVDADLAHLFCPATESVLSWTAPSVS